MKRLKNRAHLITNSIETQKELRNFIVGIQPSSTPVDIPSQFVISNEVRNLASVITL